MEPFINFLLLSISMHLALSVGIQYDLALSQNTQVTSESETRGRRDVIEEEKFYNIHSEMKRDSQPTPWLPHALPPEDPTTKVSITNDHQVLPLYQTTESITDKPTGRGARASNENWIKLPFPSRDENQDDILTPPQPSGELINSRMPRINFVTQNKQLETSESRNNKESVRPTRTDSRSDFVRPDEDERAKLYKPVYPRQAVYYEEPRRYYDDRYFPADDLYRRDPYYDMYDRRRTPGYVPRLERYDEPVDNYIPRKPKRIIYYAHLPEVVRTPPSVDLRYRYSVDPYKRVDDDYNARTGRYDYRFRSRYPYAPLRKEERNYRDLTGSSTVIKDKKANKVTPTPILPKKEDIFKLNGNRNTNDNRNSNRNMINSHQYHEGVDITYNDQLNHKSYDDVIRSDDGYLRYDDPLFQSAVDDPYQRKH